MTSNANGSAKSLKVFFHAIDGIGHLNACVGMAQALAKRGHRIYFLLNDAFKGQFAKFNFEEILLTQAPVENGEQSKDAEKEKELRKNPVKMMAQMLKEIGFLGPKTSLEKLKDQIAQDNNFMEKFYNQAVEYNAQIGDAIKREQPDLFILDSFLIPPSIRQAQIPWMLLFSPNPTFLYKSKKLPPFGSGYPSADDPANWQEYYELSKINWKKNFHIFQDRINEKFDFHPQDNPNNDDDMFLVFSPFLNIYGFPSELDYDDIVPRPDNIIAVDAFCRESTEAFEVPKELAVKPGDKLIYVSLGSMGSIDVDLMKRITAALAKTPYKYIVSKGQAGDEYELPDNCWGENFLPQTRILPLVDMVITHGGNNTVTETFAFGKPMIVLPLFGDQYDNAQRVHEKGYGIRVEPYEFTEQQLIDTINKVLNDTQMHAKSKAAAKRIAGTDSKEKVALRIEQVVAKFKEDPSAYI